MVLAPEHQLVDLITTENQKNEIQKYKEEANKKSELDRKTYLDKTGVFTGANAIHPITKDLIPIWISDYCLLYTSPSPRDQRGSRMPSSA